MGTSTVVIPEIEMKQTILPGIVIARRCMTGCHGTTTVIIPEIEMKQSILPGIVIAHH